MLQNLAYPSAPCSVPSAQWATILAQGAGGLFPWSARITKTNDTMNQATYPNSDDYVRPYFYRVYNRETLWVS
jgi:hypothetical protein